MILSRRRLFIGSAALLAAPAIVRAQSLMPVSVPMLLMPPPLMITVDYPLIYSVSRNGLVAWTYAHDPAVWLTGAQSWSLDGLP